MLVPPEVPKALVVERLPTALAGALAEHNATHHAAERVRVRLAVHAGEVHPDRHGYTSASINLAFRLVDAGQVRDALARSSGVVALVLSSWIHDEVARHSRVVDPRTFRPVDVKVKDTTATAWVGLPDDPYPPVSARTAARGRVVAAVVPAIAALSLWTFTADAPGTRGAEVSGIGA
ncbi:hypothetical protein LZG04_03715 [Saccharothrix sp. S26]|uniref:hypothetical protein n=1 Tax=Saccharothrix sp. S26 TaxID=2907215 RepID=UPI001F27067B|nr:hypothetical protein [Saccharothrix sp. S26]MCE6993922.1 hypothetical protein [Saccharothrix sp. S26]